MCGCNSELLWFIILFLLLFCCGCGRNRDCDNCPGTFNNAGFNNGCGC